MDRNTLLRAIAYNIEQGIMNSEEGKWDENTFSFRTEKNEYHIKLTDEDEHQPQGEGRDGFPNGCVLITVCPIDCEPEDEGNHGFIGKWMDYGNGEYWMAETLLSYADEYEIARGGEKIMETHDEWYAYNPREYEIVYRVVKYCDYTKTIEAWGEDHADEIANSLAEIDEAETKAEEVDSDVEVEEINETY